MTTVLFAYTHKSWNRPLTITALFASRNDGIRAMSRGISAGKLKSKFPNTVIAVEFVYLPKMRQRFNSHAKCTIRFSSRFLSLLLAGRTSTVATASKKKSKMVTSTHENMPFSSLRWKVLHFLLSRIDKLNGNFLHWKIFALFFALEKPRDIAFFPSALKRVQSWRVSRIEVCLFVKWYFFTWRIMMLSDNGL